MFITRINNKARHPVISPQYPIQRPLLSKDNHLAAMKNSNSKVSTLRLLIPTPVQYIGHMLVGYANCTGWTRISTHKGHSRLINTETDILPLLQPASDLVLNLLNDVVVHCMSCNADMRAGVYDDTSVQLLTLSSEKRAAAGLLKSVIIKRTCFWGKYVYSMSTTLKLPLLF